MESFPVVLIREARILTEIVLIEASEQWIDVTPITVQP
jgi:hypothetical protein